MASFLAIMFWVIVAIIILLVLMTIAAIIVGSIVAFYYFGFIIGFLFGLQISIMQLFGIVFAPATVGITLIPVVLLALLQGGSAIVVSIWKKNPFYLLGAPIGSSFLLGVIAQNLWVSILFPPKVYFVRQEASKAAEIKDIPEDKFNANITIDSMKMLHFPAVTPKQVGFTSSYSTLNKQYTLEPGKTWSFDDVKMKKFADLKWQQGDAIVFV